MPFQSKIHKHIEQILALCEKSQNINIIAKAVGVAPQTIYRWRDRGKIEQDGPYRQLYDALHHSTDKEPPKGPEWTEHEPDDDNLTDDMRMERTIKNSAIRRLATRTYKRRWTSTDGVRHEETIIEKPPDPSIALKALERLDPLKWAPLFNQRLEFAVDGNDWERTVREQGGDPREIEEIVLKAITEPDEEEEQNDGETV